MTTLSVNINKIATLRNARGGNVPDVVAFALACETFGADGITVHPRPDERHIRRSDVYAIKKAINVEFNIEGYPTPEFVKLVCDVHPAQVTLVPDAPEQLTSNHGWDTVKNRQQLTDLVALFHAERIRVSLFVDPVQEMVTGAKKTGADRVELYTGPYAEIFGKAPQEAIKMYTAAAEQAHALSLGLNAGHDLTLQNLTPLINAFPWIDEVSIGHQLIADALYLGIEETIRQYKKCLYR
ncbi:MAG: pyridoxine 5'-phosphate synthase [Paludibacteraceae bacterium]|nr:pyridoxine 5'-phosphate synthase [Paludibacteraceae bacterium]